jgi:hypothetical protein
MWQAIDTLPESSPASLQECRHAAQSQIWPRRHQSAARRARRRWNGASVSKPGRNADRLQTVTRNAPKQDWRALPPRVCGFMLPTPLPLVPPSLATLPKSVLVLSSFRIIRLTWVRSSDASVGLSSPGLLFAARFDSLFCPTHCHGELDSEASYLP